MIETAFALQNVSKSYRGTPVLNDTSLVGQRGQVVVVLGENGAGKTTAIRTLMGFIRPDSGTASLFGMDMQKRKQAESCRRRLGYVSDQPALYEWMTVSEIGWFCAGFYDGGFAERYEQLTQEFELPPDQRIDRLSRGMKASVSLSLALAPGPELLIMDEPTSGLDPLVRREFLKRIGEYASENRAVLLASHQVDEVENVADVAAILQSDGKFLTAPVSELQQRIREVTLDSEENLIAEDQQISSRREDNRWVVVTKDVSDDDIKRWENDDSVGAVSIRNLTLQEIYFAVMSSDPIELPARVGSSS